jgi:hypothetical protein
MVTKIILYAVLATASLAMLLLLAGFGCLNWGLAGLTALIYGLAGKLMLSAFSLLLLLGCSLLLQSIHRELAGYWRRDVCALRRVLVLQMRHDNSCQRLQQKKKQLRYWQELKRHRLLAANNRKHSRDLYKALSAELRPAMAADRYKAFQKQLKHYRKQANPEAMLVLREQAICQSSSAG